MGRANKNGRAKRVEAANALSLSDFLAKYLPNGLPTIPDTARVARDDREGDLKVSMADSRSLEEPDFLLCFGLIESTSLSDYRLSEKGWHPREKEKEMRLPDLKYILLKRAITTSAVARAVEIDMLDGFLSFMITYEDGKEVVYCYEVHLGKTVRGLGAGKYLVETMEEIGRNVGVEKSMLTVFKSNEGALRFYERLGYAVDEYSPGPRRLRNGTVKEASYLILSKSLRSENHD